MKNSHSHATKSREKPSQKSGGIITAKWGLNLEWDVQKAHIIAIQKLLTIWCIIWLKRLYHQSDFISQYYNINEYKEIKKEAQLWKHS